MRMVRLLKQEVNEAAGEKPPECSDFAHQTPSRGNSSFPLRTCMVGMSEVTRGRLQRALVTRPSPTLLGVQASWAS